MYILYIVQQNIEVIQMNDHVVPKMDMIHQHKMFYHEHYVNKHKLIFRAGAFVVVRRVVFTVAALTTATKRQNKITKLIRMFSKLNEETRTATNTIQNVDYLWL